MKLAGLIREYRREADDNAAPYFVADADLFDFANEAEEEACRRAHLLRDSTTSAVCTVAVTAGDPVVTLHASIIDVLRVKMASETVPLQIVPQNEMDRVNVGWDSITGKPRAVVVGRDTGKLRLWPTPTANETLALTVSRLPLVEMNDTEDTPEVPRPYHRALAQWMLYRVFSIRDSELFDPNKAGVALANFEREFGKRQSARNEMWRREHLQSGADPIA